MMTRSCCAPGAGLHSVCQCPLYGMARTMLILDGSGTRCLRSHSAVAHLPAHTHLHVYAYTRATHAAQMYVRARARARACKHSDTRRLHRHSRARTCTSMVYAHACTARATQLAARSHTRTAPRCALSDRDLHDTESRCRCGRGEPSPGADVAALRPVPVQMWQGRAQSRCRCGSDEPKPRRRCGSSGAHL